MPRLPKNPLKPKLSRAAPNGQLAVIGQPATDLMAELDAWLKANRHFVRTLGPDLLGLDPTYEKIRASRQFIGGVLIYSGVGDPIVLGGMRRCHTSKVAPSTYPFTVNPFSIVHDHSGESVDAAIDWLALSRVWRSLGRHLPMPQWLRVSTSLLHAVQSIGTPPDEQYDALVKLLDGEAGFAQVSLIDPQQPTELLAQEATPFLLYSHTRRTIQTQILWPKGPDQETRLDLKMLPGKWGRRYGRFYVALNIPENVAVAAAGRPLKDLLSSNVTDPYELRVLEVSPVEGGSRILFEGADLLRRCVPIFRNSEIAERFAVEVAKLADARTVLLDTLSTTALPDQWWQAFEDLVTKAPVSPFYSPGQNSRIKVWMPADPVRALLRR